MKILFYIILHSLLGLIFHLLYVSCFYIYTMNSVKMSKLWAIIFLWPSTVQYLHQNLTMKYYVSCIVLANNPSISAQDCITYICMCTCFIIGQSLLGVIRVRVQTVHLQMTDSARCFHVCTVRLMSEGFDFLLICLSKAWPPMWERLLRSSFDSTVLCMTMWSCPESPCRTCTSQFFQKQKIFNNATTDTNACISGQVLQFLELINYLH